MAHESPNPVLARGTLSRSRLSAVQSLRSHQAALVLLGCGLYLALKPTDPLNWFRLPQGLRSFVLLDLASKKAYFEAEFASRRRSTPFHVRVALDAEIVDPAYYLRLHGEKAGLIDLCQQDLCLRLTSLLRGYFPEEFDKTRQACASITAALRTDPQSRYGVGLTGIEVTFLPRRPLL